MDKAFNRARDAKKPRDFSETKLVSGGGGGGGGGVGAYSLVV